MYNDNTKTTGAPPQLSTEMELKHEPFKVTVVESLSPLTLLLAHEFSYVFQNKVSCLKRGRGEDATTWFICK